MTVTKNLSDLPRAICDLVEQNFTGEIVLGQRESQLNIYMFDGQLLWVMDKVHPVRRWQRAIGKCCADQGNVMIAALKKGIGSYQKLSQATARQVMELNQAQAAIAEITRECFFELLAQQRICELTWETNYNERIKPVANLTLSAEQTQAILSEANNFSQQWQNSDLGAYLPTMSPILNQEQKYDTTEMPIPKSYLRGNHTLWDLAVEMQTSVILIARSLAHLEKQKVIKFQQIQDIPETSNSNNAPLPLSSQSQSNEYDLASSFSLSSNSSPSKINRDNNKDSAGYTYDLRKPLIACIDDSPVLGHSVKKILTSVGYQAMIIPEPLAGMSLLVKHRPNLILLDLLMPTVTGYSVCKFLRETNLFKTTPIVILTSKDTIVDRTRAKLAGATDFITKPPEPQELLQVVRLHLTDVPWS